MSITAVSMDDGRGVLPFQLELMMIVMTGKISVDKQVRSIVCEEKCGEKMNAFYEG